MAIEDNAVVLQAEPLFYNCGDAAKRLGVSNTSLDRLRKKHKIFEPIRTEYTCGRKYHRDHLDIIGGVILGTVDPDMALTIWESKMVILGLSGYDAIEKAKKLAR